MLNLRTIRKEKGISVKDCLKATDTERRMWERYERGLSEPRLGKLVLIADFLNVSADRLLGRNYVCCKGGGDDQAA